MRSLCRVIFCLVSLLTLGAQAPAQQPELGKPFHGMPLPELPPLVDTDTKARNLVNRNTF